MALRLRSLKTRTALVIASVIVAILVLNAVYFILTKQAELKENIERDADRFARLTNALICVGYEDYFDSGFYKFRELIRNAMRLGPHVERIEIVNVSGKVLFDSDELSQTGVQSDERRERYVEDPARLEAIKKLEPTHLHRRDAQGKELLEIVAPYIEDWGRHRLSVSYHVSYRNLRPNIQSLIYATGGLTLVSIALSVVVAITLASRITRPLEKLTAGAQGIADGRFDRRLEIHSNDELEILAEAFNNMSARLKQNLEQLEESNRKLAAANEDLKELDRMKSDLLANVSHELRTPLTAIKGYTDYILDRKLGSITEKQEKGLLVVQRNLDRLSRSINALLDFSRMDVGRISLNILPFPLPPLLDQVLTTLRSELEKKQIAFGADVEPGLPNLIADREKISQVIENLVINAIKFTAAGGRITVSARKMGGPRPAAELTVQDTGIGIPEGELGRIFNRFHQVDGSTTRRFGGVGLGLAIVKSILESHGSAVTVESEEGRGTAFRFTLPVLERGDYRGAGGESENPPPPAGESDLLNAERPRE